jgi:hypothetical protein
MQFAWALSVGRWYDKNGRLGDASSMETTLRMGMVHFMAAYTGRDFAKCDELVGGLVDWPRLGRQMSYFLSKDYVADVAQDKIAEGIFAPETDVRARRPVDSTWSNILGWAANGKDRDLGPHNGPFPITELIRALHVLTSLEITLGHA